jgi:hypothetical protein
MEGKRWVHRDKRCSRKEKRCGPQELARFDFARYSPPDELDLNEIHLLRLAVLAGLAMGRTLLQDDGGWLVVKTTIMQ